MFLKQSVVILKFYFKGLSSSARSVAHFSLPFLCHRVNCPSPVCLINDLLKTGICSIFDCHRLVTMGKGSDRFGQRKLNHFTSVNIYEHISGLKRIYRILSMKSDKHKIRIFEEI